MSFGLTKATQKDSVSDNNKEMGLNYITRPGLRKRKKKERLKERAQAILDSDLKDNISVLLFGDEGEQRPQRSDLGRCLLACSTGCKPHGQRDGKPDSTLTCKAAKAAGVLAPR